MKKQLHTILGASGAMGQAVLRVLQSRNLTYRSVSRSADPKVPTEVKANLLHAAATDAAVKGSDVVYLCVGLPYDHKVWEREWEVIMNNVIAACAKHGAKLVFLDNVYMYAHDFPVPFDEQTPQRPASKKGKVRKKIADNFMEACARSELKGLIARSADFYGKGATNSVFYLSFLERVLNGKHPQLLSAADVPHTFAYVEDNARAMVDLASCSDCWGQVWHLPVGAPITMNEVLNVINDRMNTAHKVSVMPSILKKILPYLVPSLKEALEMQYQFEREYVMSFAKFKKRFPQFETTPYALGIQETIDWFVARAQE